MRTYQIEKREVASRATAVVRATLSVAEIGQFVGHAIGEVAGVLASQGIAPGGPPFARYHRLGREQFEVEVGFPTSTSVSPVGDVLASSLPGGLVAVMTYLGPYDGMEAAYGALAEWVSRSGGVPSGDPWEVYFSDPAVEPDPQKWRTEIVMPFRAWPFLVGASDRPGLAVDGPGWFPPVS